MVWQKLAVEFHCFQVSWRHLESFVFLLSLKDEYSVWLIFKGRIMDHSPTVNNSLSKLVYEPTRLLPDLFHFCLGRQCEQTVVKAATYSCTGCVQGRPSRGWIGAEIQPHSTHQAMCPLSVLLFSQRKGHFFLINTKVAKWTNENLTHTLQRHGFCWFWNQVI